MTTPLAARLAALIAAEGPIGVDRYMALCLGDPTHGYYMTRDPLGAAGDFTTAPEISQMFGEVIGAWCAAVWQGLGSPPLLRLVECGPGRGTLMADALRAAKVLPAFCAALHVHLVETSPVLRRRQEATLAGAGVLVTWHAAMDELPAGPMILVANEFLDALPARQFVCRQGAWHERLVGLGQDGGLAFGLAGAAAPEIAVSAPEGAVLTVPTAALAVTRTMATRLAAQGGAALLIDYGHPRPGVGDTLQAVKNHRPVDVLATPGEADLTVHVDFAAMASAARSAGASVAGPVGQGAFLAGLGLVARAERLGRSASPAQQDAIRAAVNRLAGTGAGEMGALFQALGLAGPNQQPLPGFDTA